MKREEARTSLNVCSLTCITIKPFITLKGTVTKSKLSWYAHDTWRPYHLQRDWKAETFWHVTLIFHPSYIKLYTKWYSTDLQLWDDGVERVSQLRHPWEHEDLGAKQLWPNLRVTTGLCQHMWQACGFGCVDSLRTYEFAGLKQSSKITKAK